MSIKKIEEMNYYEILNLKKDASFQEIKKAYHLGISTHGKNSMVIYGLLSEKERQLMVKKMKEAYQTLVDPKRRKAYDSKLPNKNNPRLRASLRKTTKRIVIEDAEKTVGSWGKLKRLFSSYKKIF